MRKMIVILLIVILISSALTACGGSIVSKIKGYDVEKIEGSVTEANSKFALDIFKRLNSEDLNNSIFISPLSISAALMMTYNGAESTTKEAMAMALRINGIGRDEVNKSYRNLLDYLKKADKKTELNIANSIWIRDGEKIREEFISNNKSNFNAEVNTLDFSKDSAVSTINKWISDATKGKIDKMLEPPISPDVIMYLINAIYFKGQWSRRFDPKETYDHIFKTLDGSEQTVKMMRQTAKVEYKKGADYKAVRLPYGNGKTSMYCILPDDSVNINKFIESMDYEKWNDIRNDLNEIDDLNLQLPKFKLEYGIKDLSESLKSLGMGEAFTDRADFSSIRKGIYISRVLHKAIIEVNEEGSKAAAATVVEMNETAAAEPITFIADKPFIFIIADDTTGTILFMGKLLSVE